MCTILCEFRLLFWVNCFPHTLHEYGFSPVCTLICTLIFCLDDAFLPQTGQTNFPSSSLYGSVNRNMTEWQTNSQSSQKQHYCISFIPGFYLASILRFITNMFCCPVFAIIYVSGTVSWCYMRSCGTTPSQTSLNVIVNVISVIVYK